jgi:hypothetical protein
VIGRLAGHRNETSDIERLKRAYRLFFIPAEGDQTSGILVRIVEMPKRIPASLFRLTTLLNRSPSGHVPVSDINGSLAWYGSA